MLSLCCSFENTVTEETHNSLNKKLEYFHVQHTYCLLWAIKEKKNSHAGNKRKACHKPTSCSQTSGTGSLLNWTRAHITIKGNGSTNMNMEKGSILMNIMMMTLI